METTTALLVTSNAQAMQEVAYKSKDKYDRENLQGVHFNGRHIVATDGKKMIVAAKGGNEPSNVTLKFSKAKGSSDQAFYRALPDTNTLVDTLDARNTAKVCDGEFPDGYLDVMRDCAKADYDVQVTINVGYLMQLAKALTCDAIADDQVNCVTLQLSTKESGKAILVVGSRPDAVGFLMPLRDSGTEQTPHKILKSLV